MIEVIEIEPEKLIVEGKVRDTDLAPAHAVTCDRRRSADGRAWHHWAPTALCGAKMSAVHPYIPYGKSSGRCPRCETIVRDLNYDLKDAKMFKKIRYAILGVVLNGVCITADARYMVTRTVTREPIVVTATVAGDCACNCVVCDCCSVKKTITRTRAANLCRCNKTEIVRTRTIVK